MEITESVVNGTPVLALQGRLDGIAAPGVGQKIAALLAGADGSSCFLHMPPAFWGQPDVACLLGSLGKSQGLDKSQGDQGGQPAAGEAFDGLVHVRFRCVPGKA
jgi:hypothetical protein